MTDPLDVVEVGCRFVAGWVEGEPAAGSARFLDTDDARYGGGSYNAQPHLDAEPQPSHGYPYRLRVNLPALGALFYRLER